MDLIKALFVPGDFSGCGYYRCMLPAKALSREKYLEADVSIVISTKHITYYDTIILQRSCSEGILELVDFAKENGRPVIYELDDDLFNIPRDNPAHNFYTIKRKNIAIKILRKCDAAIVTNNYLADKLKSHGWVKKVFVIPNFIDFSLFKQKEENGKLVLGWAGTMTHYNDLMPIIPILKQIKNSHGIGLIFIGWKPPGIEEDKYIQFQNYEDYIRSLNEIDIGIAPIIDNEFNRSKSYIKILEYNACGIPAVASAVENYKKAFRDGAGCMIAKSPKDWIKALNILIIDKSARDKIKRRGLEWAGKNDIYKNCYLWKEAIEEIMEKYPRAQEIFGEKDKPKLVDSKEEYEKIREKFNEEGKNSDS